MLAAVRSRVSPLDVSRGLTAPVCEAGVVEETAGHREGSVGRILRIPCAGIQPLTWRQKGGGARRATGVVPLLHQQKAGHLRRLADGAGWGDPWLRPGHHVVRVLLLR